MADRPALLNLVIDPFFPVVTVSGVRRCIALLDLLQEEGDYPVAFDWPRADLNVAAFEFAVGLLMLCHQPEDHAEWVQIWRGERQDELAGRIGEISFAFNLLGDAGGTGPRFMQEFSPVDGEANPVEALFIDTPGVNGQKKNADVLTHRGRFPALGLRAAAMALYALQQFAPSGGAGNRTSLRGGGPMTTLVWPDRPDSARPAPLRRVLLANLPLGARNAPYMDNSGLSRVLPWLAPTVTSEGKPPAEISEADPRAHPLQAFFGMPRRIRLVVEGEGVCPLTGDEGPLVSGFIQKPWGINYGVWRHPLTPYRQAKETEPPYSVKPKSTRFGYRDWVGVTVGRAEKANAAFPAEPVSEILRRSEEFRRAGLTSPRLLAAGWVMNNMEASAFLQSVQPLHLAETEDRAQELAAFARLLADTGDTAAALLRNNLKLALFGDGAKTSTESGVFEEATDAFFERTEDSFHEALAVLLSGDLPDDQVFRKRWLARLRRTALDLFDLHATTALLVEAADAKAAERVTEAYRRLRAALGEVGKVAATLGIAQPVAAGRTKKSRNSAEEASA